ncbi:ABC transporter ATP-binding protein [Anaerobacillus alkalidiazotrophicus]|uniref:ABC transporter ATP-binding protein n=1 Tax=Anaerobacillus alkalidiazotrophicus TaxID=472963 RepID=A0A1S2M799_9BACI|nr:ABC transporter ATP-binding protein [Anaerobacillus alkalidiazotrophicus]OIJ20682.1 ABC transporter ATP-binding protein [Anaerobacillus alkalidiazotrophicus]
MEVLNVNLKQASYYDKKDAIKDITFVISQGELVGLIGPNGAGKSTIIKSILGLMEDVDGEVVMGQESKFAYIPEHPTFYDELTLWEHIELAKAVNGIERDSYYKEAEKLLTTFRLQDEKHHYPGSFSKGMQQKLMIIIALLIKPKLYIVDEPFIGLDPKAMKDFISLLEEEQLRGAGILMSTHVLDTAEKICDRFLLVNYGRLIAAGTLEEIQGKSVLEGSLMDCFYVLMERDND